MFFVERRLASPRTDEQREEVVARSGKCLEVHPVQQRRSMVSDDRRRSICPFDGPDAETVREVQREAGADFDTVPPGTVLE